LGKESGIAELFFGKNGRFFCELDLGTLFLAKRVSWGGNGIKAVLNPQK